MLRYLKENSQAERVQDHYETVKMLGSEGGDRMDFEGSARQADLQ
jgi:hypothetical protein